MYDSAVPGPGSDSLFGIVRLILVAACANASACSLARAGRRQEIGHPIGLGSSQRTLNGECLP